MKILTTALAFAATAFLSPLAAQEGTAAAAKGYTVNLTTPSPYARGDATIVVTVTIETRRDTLVPATLVSGRRLEVTVNGSKAKHLDDTVKGEVALAGGTVITRTLRMKPAELGVAGNAQTLQTVSFEWPGTGASTSVQVAPDASKIAIEDLDLTKTRVLLATNEGTMVVRFYPDKAPGHVKNFIKLSKEGFYNGTKFHRVIKGFMIQGGCPNTKEGASGVPGTGNAGYTIKRETSNIKHSRGILSMARGGDPNSASCQFFVMHGDAPHLDGQYSAFGYLEKGADSLDRIANTPVGGRQNSTPLKPMHLHFAAVLPVLK